MKIIIAGATGFIGREVLAQCRAKSSVTSIIVLTRRPLSEDLCDDPKVVPLLVNDFLDYSNDAKEKMKDASAAIWALRAGSKEVELDYPIKFVQTIQSARTAATEPFRYMHVSGIMAEKDQEKPLWFLQEGRRVKGRAEIALRDLSRKGVTTGAWETYIARPSMVLPSPAGLVNRWAGWTLGAIGVDQLAAAMINIVEDGADHETFENAELVEHANRIGFQKR